MIKKEKIEKLVVILTSGVSREDAKKVAVEKLGEQKSKATKLVDDACKSIKQAALRDGDNEKGTAYLRLNDLYARSIKVQDVKAALAAQKEINRLNETFNITVEKEETQESQQSEELAKIAAHLLPLELAGENYPLHEHARIAADLIRKNIDD